MDSSLYIIQPGKGIGGLFFGMSKEETEQILGKPDEVERYSLDEFDNDDTEAWHYGDGDISLSFDQEYEWKLSSIAVSSDEYLLDGEKIIGLSIDDFEDLCEQKGWGELEEDAEIAEEDEGVAMLHLEQKGLSFWFEDDILSEVQLSPIFDGETVIWPNRD
jgi:hypothetical protein